MPTFNINTLIDGPTAELGEGKNLSFGSSNYNSQTISVVNTSQITNTLQSNELNNNIKIYLNKNNGAISAAGYPGDPLRNNTLDTETSYYSSDLLCEGPIEGLVDSDGYILNYIGLNSDISNSTSSLSYGVYYNDSPVRDKRTNFLNFSAVNFQIAYGNEVENFNSVPSAIYKYDSKIYDLDTDPGSLIFNNYQFDERFFTDFTNVELERQLINARSLARNFSHYVKNKYVTNATINIKVDNCFYIGGKGETYSNHLRFVVCVTDLSNRARSYYFFQGYFVVKGNASMIPIEIEFPQKNDTKSLNSEYLINVYSVDKRLSASSEESNNFAKEFSVDSIIERVNYRFSYPYSAICENLISSKHFSNVPVRSFDCKLLKIKVPENYDSDIREYDGDWNGNFSKNLKWTDNPAWIFYDLCLNSRYGLAKSFMTESDLNKWEMLKISKYCDELVITNSSTKYTYDSFTFDNDLKVDEKDFNTITFAWSGTIQSLLEVYPEKSILFLYDIKNKFGESVGINFKKIILSTTLSSGTAKIKLCNDFGARRFIESDTDGKFYNSLTSYINGNPAKLNTEENVKNYAITYISNSITLEYNSINENISQKFVKSKIFDSSLNVKSGKCVVRHSGYYDFLEPRFSANIYINDTTEGLKILSDLASIFRGVFYFRNGLLNLSIDVKKPVVYIFTNSNVKDGFFNYTSSNKETSFTVAKVSYLDKTDNFKDKIVYVEDSNLIRKFGLIEKEILGFGITSKYQAERIGKWFLATTKLESQTVTFSTGIEATNLKIGDIVRIADDLKFKDQKFGRITSLDFKNNYIYVDRELGENLLGKKIRIFSIVKDEALETELTIFEVSNPDLRLKVLPKSFISWNIVAKASASNDGSTVFGDNVGSAGWTRKAFTKQSYIKNCQISFKVTYPATYLACGLSTINAPTVDETDIDYGFFISSGALYYIEKPNSPVSFGKTITENDILKIVYDGSKIIYYLNGINLKETNRSSTSPLYGVAAFNTPYAAINSVYFTTYPETEYGKFSDLRADANFSIRLDDTDDGEDLYRIITIGENDVNEYSISAMRYSNEKFDYVDEDKFIDKNQNIKKQIVFNTDDYIRPAVSDALISNPSNLKLFNLSYSQAVSTDFDYSFYVETEVFNENFNNKIYESIELNFINYFNYLVSNSNVAGLYCNIIKDGKILKFKVYKNKATKITVFLGEKRQGILDQNSISFDIDLYAFDSNMKLINV